MWIQGSIASLPEAFPDHQRFLLEPGKAQVRLAGIPERIQVRWYRSDKDLRPGEWWRMKLRLRPPRGLVNFRGFDRERALFAVGIGAQGTVLEAERMSRKPARAVGSNGVRWAARERLREILPQGAGRALVLSLAIADRSELGRSTWSALRATGTGHLVAISGLHIGLAALAGFWLTRGLIFLLPLHLAGRKDFLVCASGALLAALLYGTLAGFPVSTLRAMAMLTAGLLIIAVRRSASSGQAWLIALMALLLVDPFAPLAPGSWLSFGAVLALIAFFSPRTAQFSFWRALPRAQLAVMAVMLPLSLFWFQYGSWLGLPSNLIAIPWVSFVAVPLTLAGVVMLPVPPLAATFLHMASWSCEILEQFLLFMAGLDGTLRLAPEAGRTLSVLGLAGGMLLLLPRGLPARWLGALLVAVLMLPRSTALSEGEYSVEALDVGQGLAVLVRTRSHSLLYDTGPGDGNVWNLFDGVIAPALAAEGSGGPDLLVVSHADLDHAGGLDAFVKRFGNTEVRFNRPGTVFGHGTCHSGQAWFWDGVHFEVLHPTRWLPYRGNDSSCVISIDNGRHRTLLTGDISDVVESRLAGGLQIHELITVPHHGSGSSSSAEFLSALRPKWAVVSAAHGNRFGFPRPEVLDRYRRHHTGMLTTMDCGAVRVTFSRENPPAWEAARAQRPAPWRWISTSPCMASSDRPMYHLSRATQ